MAGNYPDVPAPRMAWDSDGSHLFWYNLSQSTRLADYGAGSGTHSSLNNESTGGLVNWSASAYYSYCVSIVFPQLRDLVAIHIQASKSAGVGNPTVQYSTNTTNGLDGTWTNIGSVAWRGLNMESMRNNIDTAAASGIKALRLNYYIGSGGTTLSVGSIHLYGTISASESPDRLRIWHPTLDEPLDDNTAADGSHLDWGDVARGSTQDRQFRVKNNSSTLSANSVSVNTEVLSNTTPALEAQIAYSDGGAFSSNINIGNIAPNSLSPIVTVRRSTDTNATVNLWWMRTKVSAGSWS